MLFLQVSSAAHFCLYPHGQIDFLRVLPWMGSRPQQSVLTHHVLGCFWTDLNAERCNRTARRRFHIRIFRRKKENDQVRRKGHAEGAGLHFFSLSCSGGRIGTRHFVRSWFHRRTVHCIRGMVQRGPRNARSSAACRFSDASLTSLCLLKCACPPYLPMGQSTLYGWISRLLLAQPVQRWGENRRARMCQHTGINKPSRVPPGGGGPLPA